MRILRIILLSFISGAGLAADPDFSQVGFSTLDGGTTGGAGGQVVRPADIAELKRYAEDPERPYVILITKEMNSGIPVSVDAAGAVGGSIPSTYAAAIMLGSNKSLIGIGDKGFLNRVGIIIQKKRNIIIRNIRFTMENVPISKADENKMVGMVKSGSAGRISTTTISMTGAATASTCASARTSSSRRTSSPS